MTTCQPAEKWLPTAFVFSPAMISVRWVDFGSKTISEPFFNQTLKALRSKNPSAPERITSVSELLAAAESFPVTEPAGIIFHVSRCGSTLLSNALRLGRDVSALSEAQPIGTFFRPGVFRETPVPKEDWDSTRKLFLNSVTTLYARSSGLDNPKLVIKCQAASILRIKLVRAVWPRVPFVILTRDPVEVIVSNLAKPGSWMRAPLVAGSIFGWSTGDVQKMSSEEYAARGLGRFYEAAANQLDADCTVLDYAELSALSVQRVAKMFGIEVPPPESPEMQSVWGTWSKDATAQRPFEDDRNRKHLAATASARELVAKWAQPYYESLKNSKAAQARGFSKTLSGINDCSWQ